MYAGTKSTTSDGIPCQRWDSQSPHSHDYNLIDMFPDNTLQFAENFCRNPSHDEGDIWCYTTDPDVRWAFCGVQHCGLLVYLFTN